MPPLRHALGSCYSADVSGMDPIIFKVHRNKVEIGLDKSLMIVGNCNQIIPDFDMNRLLNCFILEYHEILNQGIYTLSHMYTQFCLFVM